MRKTVTLLIGAASVAALLAITACKQFLADIEEDFSYWASEPVITGFKIDPSVKTQQNNNRVLCVPSAGPVTVTMEVHNPKNFSFIMPNSPGAPTDIVSFGDGKVKGSGGAKPAYGTDYTLVPISDGKALKLTYTAAFLKANEWSDANIGASIKLYSTDGRKFNQTYKFDLEANTPPPDPSITFAKTTGSPSYYVLCIEVPAMPGAVVNGKRLHKDIAHIAINDAEYELKMNTGNTDFVRPGNSSFITTGAESLDGSGTPMTPGAWVLYYKTSTAIGGPKASYTVTLKDAKGLWSQASATTPPAPITDWGTLRTAVQTASDGAVITVGGDITYGLDGTKSTIEVTKSITVKSNVNGTKRTLSAGGTGADGSSANQKHEAVFEVKGSGITLTLEDLTLTKTEKYAVYVYNGASLVMNKVTIEDCKTSFNAAGICFHGGKDLSITDSVIKKCKGKGSSSSGGIDIQAPQAGGTLSITSTTFENCKAVGNGTRKGNGGGINIYKGSLTLSGCTFTGCEAKDGGAIFASGATVTITNCTLAGNTAQKNGGAIYVKKTDDGIASSVTISGGTIGGTDADGNKVTDMYGFGGGIYVNDGCILTLNEYTDGGGAKHGVRIIGNEAGRAGGVRANNSTVTMENCTISGNKATGSIDSGGGGVYTHGGTLTMTSCTLTHNTAVNNGGGLNIEKGSAVITNCTVRGNEAENGGAIYVKEIDGTASTVTIEGGTVGGTGTDDANKATGTGSNGNGGGIYIGEHCGLNLQDSTGTGAQGLRIIGNQAAKGKGVYATNTVVMKDRTQIDVNNDVYLDSGSKIRADSVLNPPGGTAACITVPDDKYNTGTQVLLAGTGVNPANEAGKFTVTPKIVGGTTQQWQVNNTGYLQPK
mgnify:CR=1 FL=1